LPSGETTPIPVTTALRFSMIPSHPFYRVCGRFLPNASIYHEKAVKSSVSPFTGTFFCRLFQDKTVGAEFFRAEKNAPFPRRGISGEMT
jgi:hypothetical protein